MAGILRRLVADGFDHHVGFQHPTGSLDCLGLSATGFVGLAQTGANQSDAGQPVFFIRHIIDRLIEQQEVNPGLKRFDAFIGLGRHLGIGPAVNQIDVLGGQSYGRLNAVHGHRTAADNCNGFSFDLLFDFGKTPVTQSAKIVNR